MRNFDERKAEIFRRSENRIKERKRNRNRILAVCIPLCLVITVLSVTILPSLLPMNNKNMANDGTPEAVDGLTGNSAEFVSVSVSGAGLTPETNILVEDSNKVAQIYYTVQSSFVSSGGGNKENADVKPGDDLLTEEEDKVYSSSGTTNLASGYKLTFTADNRTQSTYTLNGYVLTDNNTNKSVTLTDTQRSQILDQLGLVITWEEDPK